MAYYHVTAAGSVTDDGSSWANAMDLASFKTSIEGGGAQAVAAGDTYWIKGYTDSTVYTLSSTIDSQAQNGTVAEPISVIGVKNATTNEGANVTQSDWATTTERPKFDGGASYELEFGANYILRNLQIEGAASRTCEAGAGSLIVNCYINNDYGSTSGRYAFYSSGRVRLVDCQFTSAYCHGVYLGAYSAIAFCYFHDIPTATRYGLYGYSFGIAVNNCIFDNCAIGFMAESRDGYTLINNTFYDCDVAISETDGDSWLVINNIFSDCGTDAIIWTTQTDSNFFWQNHFYNNTDDFDGVDETNHYQDYEKTTGDPKFTTAGSDFSLQSDSPCIDAGMAMALGVG